MKKIIATIILVMITLSCKAQQIIPLEKTNEFRDANDGIPDGTYIKDVNHLLDRYLGTWKGNSDNKNYTFFITKHTYKPLNVTYDVLLIRYLITSSSGTVIEDTRSLPDTSLYVITGDQFGKNLGYYMSNYYGKDNACGQRGVVYITNVKDTEQQITLYLSPDKVLLNPYTCPAGGTKHILPVSDTMLLTKQ